MSSKILIYWSFVDFLLLISHPDKYTLDDMVFKWRDGQPLMFPNDFGDGFFRLPKYVVSFYHSNITHSVNYGDGKSE